MDLVRQEKAKLREDAVANELLRRSALLRVLDAPLFDGPLQQDLPAGPVPSFHDFTGLPELEPLPGQDGAFMVREADRLRQIARWESEVPALRAFSQKLVDFFRDTSELDVFTHLIFADPAEALKEFNRLYREADAHFDLAQCDTLLRILRNRTDLRGLDLTNALNQREQYFRARSLFSDDWLRTAYFLDRFDLTSEFEAFLKSKSKWVARLHAAGGGGKTAYLRWFIARYCIPEVGPDPVRIAVARLDLDFMHIPSLAQQPWLLIIPIAEQLNRQLVSASLPSFLASWRTFSPLLQRPVSRDKTVELPPFDDASADNAVRSFAYALGGASPLVVLDTFEEFLTHYSESVAGLLKHLATVHSICPGFKVIISGRQDLFTWRDPVTDRPAIAEEDCAGDYSTVVEIRPWQKKECWDYLTRIRGLQPSMEFSNFPEPGGGNPFKLSLFADLVGKGNSFSIDDVKNLRRVEVEYLILRVIERIPESQWSLRWLLRYAVLPRQLTKSFVQAVLGPHLRREMAESQSASRDKPEENLPEDAEIVGKRKPWQKGGQTFVAEVAWPALLRYAGSANWITLEKGEPRLQPEVVSPMRYLMQTQPIAADIHRDAVTYFEKLATAAGSDWAGMMCEAVYHQFQCAGASADEYWEARLRDKQAFDAKARRRLAELLLSGDFLDEHQQPLSLPAGKLIEPRTIAKAILELAALDVREATLAGNSRLLEAATGRLEKVRALEERHGFSAGNDGRRALVEATIEAGRDTEKALTIIAKAMRSKGTHAYRTALSFLKGAILQVDGRLDEAVSALRDAAESAGSGSDLIPRWQILTRLGTIAFQRDDLYTAEQEYSRALKEITSLNDVTDEVLGNLIQSLVQIDRSSGDWHRAEARLGEFEATAGVRVPELFLRLRGELALDTYRPEEILARPDDYDDRLVGLALAQIGDFNAAGQRLDNYWRGNVTSAPAEATQARFELIQMTQRECRNYRLARSYVSDLKDLGEYAPFAELLMMEVDVRTQKRDVAMARWRDFQEKNSKSGPRLQARALATALALELEPRSEFELLLSLIEKVEPYEARIPLLRPFEIYDPGRPTPLAGDLTRRLKQRLPPPGGWRTDLALHALVLADVYRYLGDEESRIFVLRDALAVTGGDFLPFRFRVMAALLRGRDGLKDDDVERYQRDLDIDYLRWPELAAIANLEIAEWWLSRSNYERAASLLRQNPQPGSQYNVRFNLALARVRAAQNRPEEAKELREASRRRAAELGIPFRSEVKNPTASQGFVADFEIDVSLRAAYMMHAEWRSPGSAPSLLSFDRYGQDLLEAIESSDWRSAYNVLANPDILVRQLSEIVPSVSPGIDDSARDLRIGFSESDSLAALPWEWVSPGAFRYVYRGPHGVDAVGARWESLIRWYRLMRLPILQSGSPSEAVISSIESFLRQRGQLIDTWNGPETRARLAVTTVRPVAVVKPEQEHERSERLGWGERGISVERLYKELEIPVSFFDPRHLRAEGFAKLLNEFGTLHICLPVSEFRGALQLTYLSEDASSISPSSFRGSTAPGIPPIVILDVPMPSSGEFWAQQLVWRNLLGRQLFEQLQLEAVVCAGLAFDPDQYLQTLLRGMASHEPLGGLVKSLNSLTGMAAALYALDPAMPL